MTDKITTELTIAIAGDTIAIMYEGNVISKGTLVGQSFTKIKEASNYKFLVEETIEEYGV